MGEIVKAYKESLRSFGFTPIVYDEKVDMAMTQIEDTVVFDDVDDYGVGDGNGDDGDSHNVFSTNNLRKGGKKNHTSTWSSKPEAKTKTKSAPNLRQVHEHFEVSSGIRGILKKAVDKTTNELNATANNVSGISNRRDRRVLSPRLQRLEPDMNVLIPGKESRDNRKRKRKVDAQELEKITQVRKLNFLLTNQKKVVQVDERALVRAAVTKQKRNSKGGSSIGSRSSSIGTNANADANDNDNDNDDKADDNKDQDIGFETSDSKENGDINELKGQDSRMDVQSNENNNGYGKMPNSFDKIDRLMGKRVEENEYDGGDNHEEEEEIYPQSTQHRIDRAMNAIETSEQVLADAPDSQVFFSVPEDTLSPSEPKPKPAKADEGPSITQELMDDAREKEAADRSGEWMEQEVEIEELMEMEMEKVANTNKDKYQTQSISNKTSTRQASQISASDKFFSALSEQGVSQRAVPPQQKQVKNHLIKGTLVKVQDRTWPGVNKPGGIARIMKAHTHFDAGVKYDVSYVLGGREKMVDSAFVREHEDSKGSFNSSADREKKVVDTDDKSATSAVSRRSCRVDERKKVEKWIAQIDEEEENKSAKAAITTKVRKSKSRRVSERIKSEDIVETKPAKSNKVVRRQTRKGSKKIKVVEDIETKEKITNSSAAIKKNAQSAEDNNPNEISNEKTGSATQEVSTSIRSMTFAEILESATLYYSKLAEKKHSKKKKKAACHTVFVTCSSLSKNEQSIVKEMIDRAYGNDVKLKLLKDFNPYKTSILITSLLEQSESCVKIAKARTMKAMRATLVGIPIVDVSWCKHIISTNKIIAPVCDQCITSLPTKLPHFMQNCTLDSGLNKKRDFDTATYGVPSLVASRPSLLFDNTTIFLCGKDWKTSTTKSKDVQLLVRDGGGVVLTSATQTIKGVEEASETSSSHRIVLLCDDSSQNAGNGISSPLAKVIRRFYDHKTDEKRVPPVIIVNSAWIFDSISCAALLEANRFRPCSPLASSLWELCCNNTEEVQQV